MKKRSRINSDSAKEYVTAYDIHSNIRQHREEETYHRSAHVLSTFYIEINLPKSDEPIKLHIAFDCGGGKEA
jgi:hypothetical protein